MTDEEMKFAEDAPAYVSASLILSAYYERIALCVGALRTDRCPF